MTHAFHLPDLGEGTTEAEIAAWHVKPGDTVAEEQPLVDVMTDKATVEIPSPVAGRVVAIHGAVGETKAVRSLLVEFDLGEAEAPPARPAAAGPGPERAAEDWAVEDWAAASPGFAGGARPVLASPAVRRAAHERGLALASLAGTGPKGRVLMADLDRLAAAPAPAPTEDEIEEVRLVGLRRRIAEKMAEAKRTIPHFGYVEEFDMTALDALRAALNAGRPEGARLSFLPFFVRALVRLVAEFPSVNARFDGEAGILRRHAASHVGIATQTPAGLMVPVVRHAERLGLGACAREIARVTAAARAGTATRDELTGSTITLTSLGALGGVSATPIINAPEVAIIGPNRIEDRPVVRGGAVVIRRMANVSTAFDHRVIDGHEAARFIQAMKRLIETPALLFLDEETGEG